jgi:hypothetical protein
MATLAIHSNVQVTLHTRATHHKAMDPAQDILRKGIPRRARVAIHHRVGDPMDLTWVASRVDRRPVDPLATHSIQA